MQWQALLPNARTSQAIQKEMFYGRAILVPGNRVFVISGSVSQKNTSKLTKQVQEWSLDDMTVRLARTIPLARTSFGCLTWQRYIYVVGGNTENSVSTSRVHRFDVYARTWTELPKMNESRSNPGTMISEGYLFAFGGFQTTSSHGQIGLATWEKLNLRDKNAVWESCSFAPGSDSIGEKACFYLADVTRHFSESQDLKSKIGTMKLYGEDPADRIVLMIGGWSKTAYLTEVDCYHPKQNKLVKRWCNLQLMASDMVTKRPIYYNRKLFILGRNHIHVLNLRKMRPSI